MIKTIPITQIKKNPDNPRVIKDAKFKKLVKSIQEFPEMLKIRPIVVNSDFVVLGGNQRLEAVKKAGMTEIPVFIADDLNDAQQKEFIVKDNVSAGEWDWSVLKSDAWQTENLIEWGIEDLKIEPEYEPNLDPTFDTSEVTRAELEKVANNLKQVMSVNRTFEDVICPNCGEEFSIE
jgi:ParB-like nuclease domain